MDLKKYIKDVPNFPVEGILYRDIQPLLANTDAFTHACMQMSWYDPFPDYWVGIESRGFLFAAGIAAMRQGGIKLIRKPGKLPDKNVFTLDYQYEYASGSLEMAPGSGSIVLVDDVFATGGTMEAAEELANTCGYDVIGKVCLMDIGLVKTDVKSVIKYE
jgi:adenine phosphoribosyltransferase